MENFNNDENENNGINNFSARSGSSNAQSQNNSYNQTQPNNNVNTYQSVDNNKKKSKAPIIIVVVLIVILIFGCLTIGGVIVGFGILSQYSSNDTKNNIVNEINRGNTVINTNSSENNTLSTTNTTSKTNSTSTTNTTSKTNSTNTTNNTSTTNSTSTTNNTQTGSSTVKDAKTSTRLNPLEKGTWGISSKYSGQDMKNEEVYVKVTKFTRGEEAKKIVQNYTNSKSYLKYEEPKEGLEWVVVDYDLDFASYTKPSYGANAEVSSYIKGVGDNSSVKYNGVTYILLSSRYIGSSDYVKTQTSNGKIAFQMPIGCKDYVIQLGANENSSAYFKGE